MTASRIDLLTATVFLSCFVPFTAAEEEQLTGGAGEARPLADLPAKVKAEEGKLTLFADFDDVRGEHIVLYLVNRTDKLQEFECQDGDLYVKLERKLMEDVWYRGQGHQYSWCGNSYYTVLLAPGEFYKFLGYYPGEGEERIVRYRSYKNPGLVSNRGPGKVKPQEEAAAKRDRMAIETGELEFVSQIALGKAELPELEGHWKDQRQIALYSLRRFGRRAAPVLNKLLTDASPEIQQQAAGILTSIETTTAGE